MRSIWIRAATFFLLSLTPTLPAQVMAAELKPQTRQAFDHYAGLVEARLQNDIKTNRPFLWVDGLAQSQRLTTLDRLRKGEVVIERREEKENGREIKVPDGMVHHWLALVFVPKATLQETLQLLQDYDHHKDLYKTEVVDSRLISRNGNQFKAYMRFYKKKIIGVTLNTEHAAEYVTLSASHAYSHSHTTKIAEVENAGEKSEREKPVGKDSGFLWALNSYWRIEEKDGGVYVQCEAVSLTRDIPAIVGWIVKPFVTEVPKESLFNTMTSTRAGLLRRSRH